MSLKCQTIKLNPRQYAREGHSTSDALIYLHQAIHGAADRDCGAKIFLADISKGFDIIDHSVLLTELASFSIDPALINWIKAFLISRSQAVRISNSLSERKLPIGEIPQGTKLGVILFAVMTNDLLRNWHLRIKFVDDTTVLEILQRNGVDLLNHAVSDIQVEPKKSKEMLVNSMHNHNFFLTSIVIGCNMVEWVNTYKLLGVITSDNLRWVHHIECISKSL